MMFDMTVLDLVQSKVGGDDSKDARERVPSEEEDPSNRGGKKLKGDVMEDFNMDEKILEKGESEGAASSEPLGKLEKPDLKEAGARHLKVVSYKEKLLRMNGGSNSNSEEEDWLSRQRREEEEEDLMEEVPLDASDDPLCPTYHVSKAQLKEDYKPWRKALIIKLLGKKITVRFLMARLQILWNLVSSYKLIDLDNGYLLLRLQDDGDYKHVLEEGPWIVNDHYVVV